MVETQKNITLKKDVAIYWYVIVILLFVLVVIASIAINIRISNNQFDSNKTEKQSSIQANNPIANLKTDSTKTIRLTEEQLQKFNEHILYLSEKVESEVIRTQQNNQYDIDRINTFLAVGIGFLAIIGGLLPLFVNFFSKEFLEKKMDALGESAIGISSVAATAKQIADKAKEDADKAKEDAERANGKIKGFEGIIEQIGKDIEPLKKDVEKVKEATKKVPYIDLLVLQNAVAKFTSTDALKLFIGSNRYEKVAAYLQNLIAAIDSFDNDLYENNRNFDENYFKNIIMELKLAFRLGPIRRIPDGRSFQAKIDEVILHLEKFENMDLKDFKAQLKVVSGLLVELKILVNNKVA